MTRRIAIVDGGSFVLPYDWALAGALTRRGARIDFYGSATRYNGAFLDAIGAMPHAVVRAWAVSGSVGPRWRGAWNYLRLWATLWRKRSDYDSVNLQFSVLWPVELTFAFTLRRKLVFTVHNAVPHGFAGRQHRPTRRLARLAHALVFVSRATRDDFMRRYGNGFAAKSTVLPHGVLPIRPGDATVPYARSGDGTGDVQPSIVFWGTVKPYKGVELFAALARDARLVERTASLEVHGAWAASLAPLREELGALGVVVVDDYLDAAALQALLARDALFLLPYRGASQSGALYTLLHQGRVFICADVGDLGDFMRRFGLDGLLLREPTPAALLACFDQWAAHRGELLRAFQTAQAACDWDRLIGAALPFGADDGSPSAPGSR